MVIQEQKSLVYSQVINLILVLAIIFLISKACEREKQSALAEKLNESMKDSVKIWKDKDNLSNGKILVLQATNTKQFTELDTKDILISKLQQLVKSNSSILNKNGGTAAIIATEGNVDTQVNTLPIDTSKYVLKNEIKYPIYNSNFNLKDWVKGDITARVDTTFINLKYKDSMEIVIGSEKQGFLKKRKPFANVKLLNPYSEVKDMKVYQTTLLPTKKISIGPTIMYGVGQNFTFGVFVGLGVQYNLISF